MIDTGSGSKLRGGQRLQGVRVASVNAFLPNEPPKYQSRGVRPRYRGGVPFWVRENIASFLKWCRSVGFPDSILFETEDLVSKRHLRSVIICLLEVARLGSKFGMEVPKIIHLEKQIDAELAAERRGLPKPQQKVKPSTPNYNSPSVDMHSVDEAVQEMLAECTCNPPFSMVCVSEGRYVFGGSDTPVFVRLLRGQVMVRVDDDWDTLKHFLQQHDECRKVTLQDSLAEESPADWTEGPFQSETPKEFTFQELDQESDNRKLTATDQSLINPTMITSQREMPKKFTFQGLDSDLIDLKPTPTDQSPINPTMVSVQRETPKEVMPQDLDSDLIDLRPTLTDQSPINPTTVSVQRETPNEFMPQDLDLDLIDLRPTPTGQSPVNPTTVSLQRDTPKEFMPDISDSDLDDIKPTPTDQSLFNPTTVSLQRETPKEFMPDVSGSNLDDREPTRTGQITGDPTTAPLQLEPPKEFTPQVLDPEPDDLKPTPTAYLAELGENRAIIQDDNSFEVRTS
ncbi:unnamed protein product [Dibothriocephalus latus]|uniref:GAR domain-containing protein n=1 Tax=Dibothriocephalus latus TaxID=60516 RepID=A0A3P7LHU6_DIBLA|nr:unnamed protein product [Dibothriocephalus latus]